MKALEVKNKLQGHYYLNGFNISCTEFGVYEGWADVFIIQKNGYTHEFEVKVSIPDLMSEIKVIEYIMHGEDPHFMPEKFVRAKYAKHLGSLENADYICNNSHPLAHVIPNKFSFVVPDELYARLLRGGLKSKYYQIIQLLDECGYGFYLISQSKSTWDCLERIVQPRFIHKNKKDVMTQFARRLFTENYNNFISKPINL